MNQASADGGDAADIAQQNAAARQDHFIALLDRRQNDRANGITRMGGVAGYMRLQAHLDHHAGALQGNASRMGWESTGQAEDRKHHEGPGKTGKCECDGEGQQADGDSGQAIGGIVIASVHGSDGNKHGMQEESASEPLLFRQRQHHREGGGEGGSDVTAGEDAGPDIAQMENPDVQPAKKRGEGGQVLAGKFESGRFRGEIRQQGVGRQSAEQKREQKTIDAIAMMSQVEDSDREHRHRIDKRVGELQERWQQAAEALNGGLQSISI
jgi:hypothetical protein